MSRVAIGLSVGIGAAAAFALTSDRMYGGDVQAGVLAPGVAAGLAVGSIGIGAAATPGWRWSGAQAVATGARAATRPLLGATAGGIVGLGVALLANRIWTRADSPPRSDADVDRLTKQRDDLHATNDTVERERAAAHETATAEQESARAVLDDMVAAGAKIGARGTLGEGRLDLAGRSPADAVDVILRAYADHDGTLGVDELRLAGPSTFTIDRLVRAASNGGTAATREQLVAFLDQHVDTRPPARVIDDSEALDWQAGRYGEERVTSRAGDVAAGAR